jgi:hypothetical protein
MPGESDKNHAIRQVAPDFIRPLGTGERFFHLYAQAYPVHFCLCAEIAGAVDADALRSALDRVRERHPILRARILDDGAFGPAFHTSDRPIDLETIAVGPDTDWRPTVERELEKPMGPGATALLRVTALRMPETTAIVLTFHHAIADGLSAVWVLQDMMRALAGEPLEAFRCFPPVEENILGSSPGPARSREAHRVMPASPELRSAVVGVPASLRTNIVTAEFSPNETARLIERCRANGTTVHSVLCAAAARHVPASDQEIVRIVCPFDLRKIAGIESGACGVFIGAGSAEVPIDHAASIWHDARRIGDGMTKSRSPEAVIGFMRRMLTEFSPTARSETVRAFLAAGPPSPLVVSNLGVLPIAERYGPNVVTAVWGPAMLTNLPGDRQTIGVCTFGGRLRIVHQSYVPIQGLVPAIRNTLLAACGRDGGRI